ncbi:MAG TPA: M14 family metallocarboxypeptidase [Lacunisphaera sp.]|nr:M14 family metallocarboxypeptidase [Lacunisphaera sp.]
MAGDPSLPLDPTEFIPRFAEAARRAGFNLESFGKIDGHALLAATKPAPEPRPQVYLSTGIHGDEPAPPWALLKLMEDGLFDARASWWLCPLLNPTGFLRRTRENFAGVDLNRDYKSPQSTEVRDHLGWLQRQPRFDLVICGHEDWESQGFYLYELNLAGRPTLAPAMLEAARGNGPIEAATVIDGRESAEPGIIRPVSDPLLRETWPEALYLAYKHCDLNYTIESASAQPLEQRVATQRAVIKAAIDNFLVS